MRLQGRALLSYLQLDGALEDAPRGGKPAHMFVATIVLTWLRIAFGLETAAPPAARIHRRRLPLRYVDSAGRDLPHPS
jgi:hypothetical protein